MHPMIMVIKQQFRLYINGLSSAQQSFHNPVNRVARLDLSPLFKALRPPVTTARVVCMHAMQCIRMAMAPGPVLDHTSACYQLITCIVRLQLRVYIAVSLAYI